MEVQKICDELEGIVESKRVPNALIFEADGSNSELKMSLEFAKKYYYLRRQTPSIKTRLLGEYSPFHIQIYTLCFRYQFQITKKRTSMITILKVGLKWL